LTAARRLPSIRRVDTSDPDPGWRARHRTINRALWIGASVACVLFWVALALLVLR
jgi:hypothetical protein